VVGDVISLDYGLASLYDWTGYVDNAVDLGKPVSLWAASVGPFTAKPYVERFIVEHLAKYSALSVRESATHSYLDNLGVATELVADPAFTMAPEPFDHETMMPEGADGCLGLNFSPLIRGYRKTESSRQALDVEIIQFVEQIIRSTDLGVLFVPHVGPLDGGAENSDYHYMKGLIEQAGLNKSRVRLAPPNLNAAQLKHLISHCRFFIGARTHATVAALSTGVPTTSIAYSVKAKGINQDLFGHLDHVLETPKVTCRTMQEHLLILQERETEVREYLLAAMPGVRAKSGRAADHALQQIQDTRS
jgi:colanic acid/amylovoran biosynthesis protein